MPSKNKKQNIKAKDDITPNTSDNVRDIAQEGDNKGSSAYYVPPHLCEVYARICNHIASGNILNPEENKKHKAWLEQHRPR